MSQRSRTLPARSRKELKEIAFRKSLTLEQLATEIGIHYGTLHTGLVGGNLDERTLFKIDQFLEKAVAA